MSLSWTYGEGAQVIMVRFRDWRYIPGEFKVL